MRKHCLYCHKGVYLKVTWNNLFNVTERPMLCDRCSKQVEWIRGNCCKVCSRLSKQKLCFDCKRWNQYYQGNDPLNKNISIYKYNQFMKEIKIGRASCREREM